MTLAWLDELLPLAVLTPTRRIMWLLFFTLFPLAYVGGVMLETQEESPAMMTGFEDRAASMQTARQFALSKGYPVAGWKQYAITETDKNLLEYYGNAEDPVLSAASLAIPGEQVQVLFRSPDQSHEFRTYLSLMGHVTGYDFGKATSFGDATVNFGAGSFTTKGNPHRDSDDEATMVNATASSDQQAETIARAALAQYTNALKKLLEIKKPRVRLNEDDSARRDVIWEGSPAGRPELTINVLVGVRDSTVVSERITAKLDKKHKAKRAAFQVVFVALYSCFLALGAIYAVIRYAKRTLQKEVSHVRTTAVAGLFVVTYSALIYSVASDQVATHVSGAIFSKIGLVTYLSGVIVFSLMGLLVGIAYGSGEGEVREAYPGKLTSLDALLAGRIFSRDVGASVLFGVAAAAWFLLGHHLLSHFLRTDVMATRSDVLTYTFSRLPWLTLLVGRQYDPLLIAVTGLLLPASFLLGRKTRKAVRLAGLVIFALGSVLNDASKFPDLSSALLAMMVLACALLLPFFTFDVLAAMVSLSALSFVEEITRLSAVFPSWNEFAVSLASLAGVTVIAAAFLALRGRPVREEDVTPLYAKYLAQRMALQAEVTAAREAQLRLLPQAAPELPGVQFAAVCLPARGVGGDFYDFFRLDADRVGIFVAQGSDQGLASALCIALAKGILMHSSLQPDSPTQIVADLEESLSTLLEGDNSGRVSFAYAVIDNRRNLLTYARVGDFPRLVVHRQGVVSTTLLEKVVTLAGRSKSAPLLHEGSTHTSAGDFLIFFTRGVTSLRLKRFGAREYQWVDALLPLLERYESLQAALTTALSRHQRRASDDLTAVVLRIVRAQLLDEEVVA